MKVLCERRDRAGVADGVLVAVSKLYKTEQNPARFSVTGTVYTTSSWATRAIEGYDVPDRYTLRGGAIADEVADAIPELAPVAALHLSDDEGVPLHAVENGWYWYSDYDGKGVHLDTSEMSPLARAADYLRMAPEDLPEGLTWEEFANVVDAQRDRWLAEADQARLIIERKE